MKFGDEFKWLEAYLHLFIRVSLISVVSQNIRTNESRPGFMSVLLSFSLFELIPSFWWSQREFLFQLTAVTSHITVNLNTQKRFQGRDADIRRGVVKTSQTYQTFQWIWTQSDPCPPWCLYCLSTCACCFRNNWMCHNPLCYLCLWLSSLKEVLYAAWGNLISPSHAASCEQGEPLSSLWSAYDLLCLKNVQLGDLVSLASNDREPASTCSLCGFLLQGHGKWLLLKGWQVVI